VQPVSQVLGTVRVITLAFSAEGGRFSEQGPLIFAMRMKPASRMWSHTLPARSLNLRDGLHCACTLHTHAHAKGGTDGFGCKCLQPDRFEIIFPESAKLLYPKPE
jgi:hypothetical protein